MKAVIATDFGGPEVLRYTDMPDPEPGAGEVRIKLVVAGVNFIDVYNLEGLYSKSRTYGSQPPFVLGREGAGTVDAARSARASTTSPWATASPGAWHRAATPS